MSKKRVLEGQLDFRRHTNAAERQKIADELNIELVAKRDQLRLTQLLIKDEVYLGNRPGPWDQWKKHREDLKNLREREEELAREIQRIEQAIADLGGHPRFRLPVVHGYGLGDALRRERAKGGAE